MPGNQQCKSSFVNRVSLGRNFIPCCLPLPSYNTVITVSHARHPHQDEGEATRTLYSRLLPVDGDELCFDMHIPCPSLVEGALTFNFSGCQRDRNNLWRTLHGDLTDLLESAN